MSRYAFVPLALLLLACRSHPCGDQSAEAPAKIADAPLTQEGGKICDADNADGAMGHLTVMYWGDEKEKLTLQYRAAFDSAGWTENLNGGPDLLAFEKGELLIQMSMSKTETPRFGAKMWSPSLRVGVTWYDRAIKE